MGHLWGLRAADWVDQAARRGQPSTVPSGCTSAIRGSPSAVSAAGAAVQAGRDTCGPMTTEHNSWAVARVGKRRNPIASWTGGALRRRYHETVSYHQGIFDCCAQAAF